LSRKYFKTYSPAEAQRRREKPIWAILDDQYLSASAPLGEIKIGLLNFYFHSLTCPGGPGWATT
ncbi:MAG: hypothetical protein ACM3YE_03045, partial [Bacteroidota bacterium]